MFPLINTEKNLFYFYILYYLYISVRFKTNIKKNLFYNVSVVFKTNYLNYITHCSKNLASL